MAKKAIYQLCDGERETQTFRIDLNFVAMKQLTH